MLSSVQHPSEIYHTLDRDKVYILEVNVYYPKELQKKAR